MFSKEALELLFDQNQTKPLEIDGKSYTTKPVYPIEPKMPALIQVNTLQAVIDYINSGIELVYKDVFVHIADHQTVEVFEGHNEYGKRKHLIQAKAQTGFMEFGRFMDMESFIIRLQSAFVDTPDRAKVLAYVANIDHEHVIKTTDNGMSQKTAVKVGIVDKEELAVPNPVRLAPYRTFVEVPQPESNFVLRLKDDGSAAALFEADGGAWKLEAMDNVSRFIGQQLADTTDRNFLTVVLA